MKREVHKFNIQIEKVIKKICKRRKLVYRHNVTSINSKDGYHRYLILDPSISNSKSTSITSKNCIAFSESRFSKWYKPSIKGESKALFSLFCFLENSD